MTDPGLTLETRAGVLCLRLDRPGGNRFSFALLERLAAVFTEAAGPGGPRAVLWTAGGPDFSFGADLTDPAMAERVAGAPGERAALARLGQDALDAWCRLPVPTVVAARGRIIGAGACFFATADFALAAPGAAVHFPEVDRGMHLSWGVVPRLVARYGLGLAAELALAASPVACERLGAGPVRTAADPDGAAEALAAALASKPPLAVRAVKAVLVKSGEGDPEAGRDDPRLFAETIGSADFAEAMAAWFEKRPGRYDGR